MVNPELLLFIPGANAVGEFWRPVADLVEHPAERLLIDLPDVSSIDELVEHAKQRVTRPTAVIAQSMGGIVAMRMALELPELITHLVLTVTSGGIDVEALGGTDWRANRASMPGWMRERTDLSEQLRTVAAPTLLVWAEHDPISPLAVGELLHELIPHSELVSYPSDDHWVVVAESADVAARITVHLAQ